MLKVLVICPNRRTINIWAPFYKIISENDSIDLTILVSKMSEPMQKEWESSIYFSRRYRIIEVRALFNKYSDLGHSAPLTFSPLLYRHLIGKKYDIIHVLGEAGYMSTFQVALYKLFSRNNLKMCIRGAQNVFKKYPRPFRFFEKVSYRAVDSIICNGADHEEVIRKKGYTGRVDIIYLGVDTHFFIPKDSSLLRETLGLRYFTFGFVGKLTEQKGIDDLIDAFSHMPEDTDLLLIGSGPLYKELIRMKEQSFASNRIIFVKHVPHNQVVKYINCMDVLVLPSKFIPHSVINKMIRIPWKEQFGRVLVEAMACKVAVIGSDSGEIPFVIGDAGLIFKSGDRNDLFEKMMRVYNDRQLLKSLAEEGFKKAQAKYSWDVIGKQVINLWKELTCKQPYICDVSHE